MRQRGQLIRVANSIIRRNPKLGFLFLDVIHRIQYQLNQGNIKKNLNNRKDWIKLLGPDTPIDVSDIRYRQSRNRYKEEILVRLLKKEPLPNFIGLISWKNLHYIRQPLEDGRPVILGFSHVGPLHACALGLLELEVPITFLLYRPISGIVPEGWELCYTGVSPSARVQSFKTCRKHLKSGRPVVIACDVFTREENAIEVNVFDMKLKLTRGFAALARSSGARVIPVSIQWNGPSNLMFEAYPPLENTEGDRSDREGFEIAVVEEYAKHIDTFMRRNPSDLEPQRVDLFVNAWNRIHSEGKQGSDIDE